MEAKETVHTLNSQGGKSKKPKASARNPLPTKNFFPGEREACSSVCVSVCVCVCVVCVVCVCAFARARA